MEEKTLFFATERGSKLRLLSLSHGIKSAVGGWTNMVGDQLARKSAIYSTR